MLFVILGWSEAYLQRAPLRRAAPARAATVGAPMPRLRVIR
jgi:hypothetical protein